MDFDKVNPCLGQLGPFTENVARRMTGLDRIHFPSAGTFAANDLGLSELVPANAVLQLMGVCLQKINLDRDSITSCQIHTMPPTCKDEQDFGYRKQ